MKLGFFGTPRIAAYCLEKLLGEFEIAFAVAGEDREQGRRLKVEFSPVKLLALERGIPLYQPAKLKDDGFAAELARHGADLFVIVAYGKIIPASVFNMPRYRTINLHPSLLPKYRGAAPVEWALINGEHETGISVQMINERLDAGDVLAQETIPLDRRMNAGDLYDIVLPRGAALLAETIRAIGEGRAVAIPQDERDAKYCGKIDRDTAHIDWRRNAGDIHNLVRGLHPNPVAWPIFRKNVRIWKTEPFEGAPAPAPGELAVVGKKRLIAGTGGGALEILSIQPETKKAMDGLSFINGYRPAAGEGFE
jgi:methionyl-tRNA formyltransferase